MTLTAYALPFSNRARQPMPAPIMKNRPITEAEYDSIRIACKLVASRPGEEQYNQRLSEQQIDMLYVVRTP
jgi:hypothetical protein